MLFGLLLLGIAASPLFVWAVSFYLGRPFAQGSHSPDAPLLQLSRARTAEQWLGATTVAMLLFPFINGPDGIFVLLP